MLYEITQGLNSTSNLDELLRFIQHAIGQVLYARNFFIALHNQTTGMLSMELFIDEHDEMPAPQKLGRSRTAYVMRTARPLLMTPDAFKRLVEAGEINSLHWQPS